jgi:outer membrane beta-barrel protein
METGIRVLLLTVTLAALSGCATVSNWYHHRREAREEQAQAREDARRADQSPEDDNAPRVVDPTVERRKITVPRIRSANVELGVDYGALSVEDFGTNPSYGATLGYHVTEDFFLQAEYGRTKAGRTSFETLGGNIQLLTPRERHFTYYDLSLGYNFLPGEAFLGRGIALSSAFYLIGGIGGVDFAGDQKFAVNFGAGFRVLPSDWLAVHITVQDRVFQSDLLGTTKLTNNIEMRVGTTVFF